MELTVGDAETVAPLVVFKPDEGDQLKTPLPPDAVRFTGNPSQMDGFAGLISRIFTPVFAAILKVQLSLLKPSNIK